MSAPKETTAARACRLLGTRHPGAGSRLGDLAEALRRLEAAQRDLRDWRSFAPIPRSRCGACGHLSVVSGYVCACCGADPDDEGACRSGCDPDYGCDCPPP